MRHKHVHPNKAAKFEYKEKGRVRTVTQLALHELSYLEEEEEGNRFPDASLSIGSNSVNPMRRCLLRL